jgi:hypothetical protein
VELRFEHRYVDFLLAEQRQFAAVLYDEKVGQPTEPDTLQPGRLHQHSIEAAESRQVISQPRAGQHVPSAAMGAGAVKVEHLRQHAGRGPGKQPGQQRHRLRRPVRGPAAELVGVDYE